MKTSKFWVDVATKMGALWITDEDPRRPHALLASGRHSGCYFNAEKLAEFPDVLDAAAADATGLLFAEEARAIYPPLSSVTCVVGPALGAVTLAHDLARHLGRRFPPGRHVRRAFVEKDPSGADRMICGRCEIRPGETYLLVEDVVTTAASLEKTAAAVLEHGGIVHPVAAAILNRSGSDATSAGRRIVALVERRLPTWAPEDCPLCAAGSRPVRPKLFWTELNQVYEGKK